MVAEGACPLWISTQVGALLTSGTKLDIVAVKVDDSAVGNYIMDSGGTDEVVLNTEKNAFRPTPSLP